MMNKHMENLAKYAALAVEVGVNLQAGQKLWLTAVGDPAATAPLVRAVAKKAYEMGAQYVDVSYQDEQVAALRLTHAPEESLSYYPDWHTAGPLEYAQNGDGFLSITAVSPDYLDGIDPQKIGLVQKIASQKNKQYGELRSKGAMNWSVIAAASPAWAAKVFPDAPVEEQVDLLWEA
ncbi:MAG: aminopeptidase, partial [Anaerolineales bacterium]|nr:aminopeptidase [Anaerolineales bacterium]